ncbi:MAG: tyrosine--tRNA ligase [Deltaproteobacteria bacterium]|uniref:Tyrosine--tRNA ligase n=1 Tax=Candidatus Zymogenus saltonus TaxID=2844893 RepID=A0A9D8KDL0_9DELT|nr:tyrosine--tRNA ligase [Candidatus Zymogenus saltonus]
MNYNLNEQMDLILRGTVEIISEEEMEKKVTGAIKSKKPLIVKAGFDPTAPDLHLGHTVLIQKLKHFQELGHTAVFLIGDFTGMIGDPSGRSDTREQLTREVLLKNAETYKEQVFKILDEKKTVIEFNSNWMRKMSAEGLIELAAQQTVARMLEREDFNNRFKSNKPISIHEFLYPLVQGYDSVALKADVELGGTDQIFNLFVGRDLQRHFGQEPQVVITVPILVGTDGVKKMGKSNDNYIGITEPAKEIFGKVMSLSDELMLEYYELLSDITTAEFRAMKEEMKKGTKNPKEAKEALALELAARFWGKEEADNALEEFGRVFAKGEVPTDVPEGECVIEKMAEKKAVAQDGLWIPRVLTDLKLTTSTTKAKQMIKDGAVSMDGEKLEGENRDIKPGETHLFKVGRLKFMRISFL